jgi:glycosyltransferase involved in cell wall biosynthesis
MKLCIVSSGDFFSHYGGGQVYVHNLVDELIREKEELNIELSVISFSTNFSLDANIKDYHSISLYEIHPQGNIHNLLKIITPDLVHANGEKALMAHVCKELHIPCVVTAHHGGLVCPAGALLNYKDQICQEKAEYKKCLPCYLRNIRSGNFFYHIMKHFPLKCYLSLGKQLEKIPFLPFVTPIGQAAISIQTKLSKWKQLNDDTTYFIAPSEAISEALIRNGVKMDKMTIIPHGVPRPKPIEYKEPSIDNITKFYYVGRICYIKGIHILLKAFNNIRSSSIELHLIGDAIGKSDHRYMRKLKKKYHNDIRITWHGNIPQKEVATIIQDYNCLIHPTICLEVFGLDIAEAFAQGKNVIATRCGGAEMQIKESDNPWLVEPDNVNALQKAIEWYIKVGKTDTEKYNLLSLPEHIQLLSKSYSACLYGPHDQYTTI